MMCQCDCETPGHRVSLYTTYNQPYTQTKSFHSFIVGTIHVFDNLNLSYRNTLKMHLNVLDMVPTCVVSASVPKITLVESVSVMLTI